MPVVLGSWLAKKRISVTCIDIRLQQKNWEGERSNIEEILNSEQKYKIAVKKERIDGE